MKNATTAARALKATLKKVGPVETPAHDQGRQGTGDQHHEAAPAIGLPVYHQRNPE